MYQSGNSEVAKNHTYNMDHNWYPATTCSVFLLALFNFCLPYHLDKGPLVRLHVIDLKVYGEVTVLMVSTELH